MSWDSYGGLPPGANFDPSFLPQNSYGAQFYAPAHSADQDEEQYYDPTSPDSETELASTWNAHHPANTFSPSNNTAGPSNTTGITNNPVDKKSQSNIKTENIQHHKDNTNDILHTTYTPNAGNTVKKTAKVADTSPNMLTMTEQPKGGDLASSNMTVVSQSSSATLGAERPGQNEPMLNENSGSDVWPPSNSKTKLADQKTTKHSTKTTIATPNSGPSDQEQQDEQMDNDLEHWLELTGYHNIANRKRLLTIHRRRNSRARSPQFQLPRPRRIPTRLTRPMRPAAPPSSPHRVARLRRGGSLRGGGGRDVSPVPFNSLHDDARYFIIKSWNHENVDIAMREGSWVTQAANEGMFADAYRNSRNVILFFSVNKSATFQGYARMDSAPGAATPPSWVNELRWPASAPFKVHWIRKRDTHFSKVGHLKNAFNDDQPVLVGRDGQEVEESCGRALCEIIDEESRW
ncbi:YTH-domain-containing protein [Trichodelitschia bisporula]|uniref:YTH-domain-containing protein n=1 Tax=Trichodelitschia bisporula TaxID=703511 RepID=A0A6G1HYD8_9PEZI|nr:YTH-domain-containing protein [Trichodelitschia bisporula]